MKIGIDGNEANIENKVGISEFAYRLLLEFYKKRNNNLEFEIFLKKNPNSDLPKGGEFWKYRIVGPRPLWTQIGLPFALFTQKNKPDIFFTPTHYAPRISPIPTVVSVMDLSFLHFPNLFATKDLHQLRSWTSYSIKKAKGIIAISQSSKDDIIDKYKIPKDKIKVVYLGVKESMKNGQNMSEVLNRYNIKKPFILFVGTLQPRKNITKLIEAFARVRSLSDFMKGKNSDLNLVVIGKKGWLYEEIFEAPKKFGVEKEVKFLDFVKDDELQTFYKNAVCFVLPSLYEGFGLPVLEAMKFGCPVITSSISSMPEAGGDAALYVDPNDVSDISEKIEKVVLDEKLQEVMRKKGYSQVKKFSWEKAADEVLEVLEDVWKKEN